MSQESFIIIDNIVCTIHSMTCIYTGTWQWLSSQCKYMPIMHLPWYVHVFAVFPCICLLLANPLCMRFCIHQYCWQAKADSWCEFLLIQSLTVMYIQILLFYLPVEHFKKLVFEINLSFYCHIFTFSSVFVITLWIKVTNSPIHFIKDTNDHLIILRKDSFYLNYTLTWLHFYRTIVDPKNVLYKYL